jgi:hypothetical protein
MSADFVVMSLPLAQYCPKEIYCKQNFRLDTRNFRPVKSEQSEAKIRLTAKLIVIELKNET